MKEYAINIVNALGKLQCDPYPLQNLENAIHDIDVNNCKILKTEIDQEKEMVKIIIEAK